MLQTLARHPQRIAWFFYALFVSDLAIPVVSRASEMPYIPYAAWRGAPGITHRAAPAPTVKNAAPSAPLMHKQPVNVPVNQRVLQPDSADNGPTQPEMQSFQSVNASNMVDLFSGDFSYNIPLLDVGGYPINIHYSSGITMDQEASWVGLGWNINPGTISRNMRGLPDDFDGTERVEKTMSMKPNTTIGVTGGADAEIKGLPLTVGVSLGVLHNNYKGWGTESAIDIGINAGSGAQGPLSGGLSIANNSQDGLDVSPSLSYRMSTNEGSTNGSVTIGTNYNSRRGINGLQMTGQMSQQSNAGFSQRLLPGNGISSFLSFSTPSYTPTITIPFTSSQFSFKTKFGSEAWSFFSSISVKGYASIQKIAPADTTQLLPSYGYLYYQNARGGQNALLDFNREKEVSYRDKVPHIAVPVYTYDTYSITGEGTGGMFRPYRGDIGYVYDHAMSSKSNSTSFTVDAGFGSIFHGGVDFSGVYASTKNNPWYGDNILKDVIPFRFSDSIYESVYFKNPGEKTLADQAFYNAIGDTKLMRVDLSPLNAQNVSTVTATRTLSTFANARQDGKITFGTDVYRKQRDKRTQVITWLKASEASSYGLDKAIKSYHINNFPTGSCNTNYDWIPRIDANRKKNHLSEITVLNNDGRRYVYGVPVYNFSQSDVSFAVEKQNFNSLTGQVKYAAGDNTTNNGSGIDNYFNREVVPAYAHSFLLSGILSPDYVDITGDGISEDDNGEAIKFNYTEVYNVDSPYRWRAPFDSAAYNEGLKTDKRNARGSYSYGTKEIWYLNSVESKTMMAAFKLETDSARQDAVSVTDENGGRDANRKLYRLKEINLYTKADFIKNGASAKPIKTVHFDYSYELCPGTTSSIGNTGKLTLKRIWFSYNKNVKGRLNPYVFTYHSNNPSYLKGATDRWGNYKDSRSNPGQLSNADYSYTLQVGQGSSWDSTKAANNAAAWTLNKIKLPSGGEIRVSYESDDYAYVQNKRAMQLFTLAGFGENAGSTPLNNLYNAQTKQDYRYVFVNITDPVTTKADIQAKYLDGVTKLYFKLLVTMPGDIWGKGSEFVPFYAEIDDYGVKGSSSDKQIWIKLKDIPDGSPAAVAAFQYLRLNLPSKAYPLSEPGDNVNAIDVLRTLVSVGSNIKQAIKGFNGAARSNRLCNIFTPSTSFVRLDNPLFKKLGGGLRVKKVEVFDNFSHMSHAQQQDAIYGQEYDYSTTSVINNVPARISSGVATYEPAIGGEENPFHVPIEFTEKVAPLAPANYKYTEEPLGETYFPGPSVGYSKVTVRTTSKDKKSATGLEETQFYTSRDFPTLVEFTPLDNESKKPYAPGLQNFLRFSARHDITLSQGFKVELNDMNGKIKSQASYPQNDTANPISYTYNYYNVENENTLQKRLSGTVSVADSTNGVVTSGQMGKDIEVMVDLREQTSSTQSISMQVNIDIIPAGFIPLFLPSLIPVPTSENNRYRSIAVMKVVNRYGILDSVIHMEKGSKVSTKNMVYDGETGEVLLSRTNNEYDDPIYNFVYPAHWAYSGMGPAYKNIRSYFTGVHFRQGRLFGADLSVFNTARYIESGDELWVSSKDILLPLIFDPCNGAYYNYLNRPATPKRIWAIEASKGLAKDKGIYFIDKNGNPFSGNVDTAWIIRSGRRNMSSTPIGSVTSLQSPLKTVSGALRFVFDSTTQVVAAGAARFKDFWRVDSSLYRKDTTFIRGQLMPTDSTILNATDAFVIDHKRRNGNELGYQPQYPASDYRAYSDDDGGGGEDNLNKSWLRFSFTETGATIPANSVILNSRLYLYNDAYLGTNYGQLPHQNLRNSNSSYLSRIAGAWAGDSRNSNRDADRKMFFDGEGAGFEDKNTRVTLSATPHVESYRRNDTATITSMTQAMLDDYYGSAYVPSIMISLVDPAGDKGAGINSTLRYSVNKFSALGKTNRTPHIKVVYCLPCANAKATYSTPPAVPVAGYYCYDLPKDSFMCRPNIVDSAVNPYRWGILGNWRMDRAYTYYDRRQQSDPSVAPNIRKDGQIKSFVPYWSFTSGQLAASTDSSRWVWNSEMTLFNRRGYEIENHDPLNRYNSGQYGYNGTMPVAAAQNAQNREMFFDGLEDYNYKTDTCASCGLPRFINLVGTGTLVDTVSHTGRYSLRVNGAQSDTALVKIASLAQDAVSPGLSVQLDSTYTTTTTVIGTGTGLTGTYRKPSGSTCLLRTDTALNFSWGLGSPGGSCTRPFNVVWSGNIQPRYTDNYIFSLAGNGSVRIFINDTLVMDDFTAQGNPVSTNNARYMTAGKLYHIRIEYTSGFPTSGLSFYWQSTSLLQPYQLVPGSQLYGPAVTDADVTATIHHDTTVHCILAQSVKATRVTLDRFSPLQGRKMVVSAWVKEDQACIPGAYQHSQVVASFDAGSPSSFTLQPTGRVIEGWQRVEDTLTIPASATTMRLIFKSTNSSYPAYFDDVRMHPFNSNMKSFVYDPVNLRLMAELDENNYATFYEYDDDGTLVRLKKETERGIKTIKETRSALLKD